MTANTKQTYVAGWGRYPVASCGLRRPEKQRSLTRDALDIAETTLARGQGRSYGDASLNSQQGVILTERLNRVLSFDADTGLLRAEAGMTLAEVLDVFVPRGWFLPVTPGTKFCSLGGCVAADVHGKNHHHDGTFSRHVPDIELLVADGQRLRCGPDNNAEIFWATVGGMGLTGIITEVSLQLVPIDSPYVEVTHRQTRNLDATLALFEDESADDHYSVAWIDCLARGEQLGRSVVMTGHHVPSDVLSKRQRRKQTTSAPKITFPIDLPSFALNPLTIGAFNEVYYRLQGRKETFLSHYDSFFYPLDGIRDWNRMYGRRGFVQYQFVLPHETSSEGIAELLETLAASRKASFLAVLKRFGDEGLGHLSFPKAGYTLALDIAMDDSVLPLLERLDDRVLELGGRLYLAKDARMRAEDLPAMYPRLDAWREIKRQIDPDNRFTSDLARRLKLTV